MQPMHEGKPPLPLHDQERQEPKPGSKWCVSHVSPLFHLTPLFHVSPPVSANYKDNLLISTSVINLYISQYWGQMAGYCGVDVDSVLTFFPHADSPIGKLQTFSVLALYFRSHGKAAESQKFLE